MDVDVLQEAILNSFINNEAQVLLSKLQGLVTNVYWTPSDVADLFVALLERFDLGNSDGSHFLPWLLDIIHLIEIHFVTPTWKCHKGTAVELVRDPAVSDGMLKHYFSQEEEKQLGEIIEEIRQTKLNHVKEAHLSKVQAIVSSVYDALHSKHLAKLNDIEGDLLRLCQAAEKAKFRPRLTQMVSWCIMALSETGQFIQVATGEGKSCIVAMFAAYRAMKGKHVHILSSSPVLAERDMKDWSKLFNTLKISVDCNTNKQEISSLQKCYECQVVYGTAEKFAGDYLTQRFKQTDIFGQEKIPCAIVDEEDSIMLDKALHVIYIGNDMPALQHLNSLLASIWAVVNTYSKIHTNAILGPKCTFLQVALSITKAKYATLLKMAEESGVLPKGSTEVIGESANLLTTKITNATVSQLARFFKILEDKHPCFHFALHCQNSDGSLKKLNTPHKEGSTALLLFDGGLCCHLYRDEESIVTPIEEEVKNSLHFTPCELTGDEPCCYVPGFLSGLVQSKIKVWIRGALMAQKMTKDHEYVQEEDRVVPVDYSSTGVIENFMKWTDGLHQFLELKHKLKLSDMTLITNYMSNVGLLQKYGNQIFGLTGTLGQQAEMETLEKVYGIKTCQIPAFKRKKQFEVEGVIVDEEEGWIKTVCNVVSAQIQATSYRGQRAVLVICETIKRARAIHRALRDIEAKLYISNNMDNRELLAKELTGGDIIIATNLAGRGADFKVSNQVKAAGGLFVVQTFLPENSRVEAQAFGRTARQGSPGSAQLIICCSHLPEPLQSLYPLIKLRSLWENLFSLRSVHNAVFVSMLKLYQTTQCKDTSPLWQTLVFNLSNTSDSEINEIKNVRDQMAAKRLATLLEHDIPNMKVKEHLFQEFLRVQDGMSATSSKSELSALNEYWGFWLLTNGEDDDSSEKLKEKLSTDLDTARKQLQNGESPFSNLHYYTTAGNELLEKGNFEQSILMYTKAIMEDPCWAAFACYNRAFARLLQKHRQDQNCIRQAMEDLQQAQVSIELYWNQTKFTQRCYKQVESNPKTSISRFDRHMKTRQKMFMALKENIDMALNKLDKARARGGFVKVDRAMVNFLVPMADWLPSCIFLASHCRNPLMIYRLMSNSDFDMFQELQCLDSLGLPYIYTLDTVFSLGGFLSKMIGII